MAVKLDMERAYDRLRWDFVRHTLQSFGFHGSWIDWIMACVVAPPFSLLINGTPTPYFQSTIGLRQGCPLSPYLFILCADLLSRALREACRTRAIEAFAPAPGAGQISHLMFADDCLLMLRARPQEAQALKRILIDYCAVTGQRVNLLKSSVCFSPKLRVRMKHRLLSILDMREHVGAWTYLGVPITGRRLRTADCLDLVQRVQTRLAGWRASSLSMMGRVTLVRTVLGALPIYLMAHTTIPQSVILMIERLMRAFIWGSYAGGHGTHLVSWASVCRPTREGGLGVCSLVQRREVLLARQAARVLLEPHSLWSQVVMARYGLPAPGRESLPARRGSYVWRDIQRHLPTMQASTRWAIGDGRSVQVLEDSWVDCLPLQRWPTLVNVEAAHGLRVCDLLHSDGSGWDQQRIHHLFGEPLAVRVLSMPVPSCRAPDLRVWRSSCRSTVRARDIHVALFSLPDTPVDAAWIWRVGLHPRVALFLWKVAWRRLPTCSLLCRRHLRILASCPVCGDEETGDHAILHCLPARRIWLMAGYSAFWPTLQAFLEQIRHWAATQCTRPSAIRAAYLAYHIWLDRNARLLGDGGSPPRLVLERATFLAREIIHPLCAPQPLIVRDIWRSPAAPAASLPALVAWEPPPLNILKVNFDGSVREGGRLGGAGFVIRDSFSQVIAAGGCPISGASVPGAELTAAWAGIRYARLILQAPAICLEGDSATVIGWIQDAPRSRTALHPLLRDIREMTSACSCFWATHVYREANGAADWVASYVAAHSGPISWTDRRELPAGLLPFLFSDFLGCARLRQG